MDRIELGLSAIIHNTLRNIVRRERRIVSEAIREPVDRDLRRRMSSSSRRFRGIARRNNCLRSAGRGSRAEISA